MVTYIILNIAFLIAVCVVLGRINTRPSRAWWTTLIALLLLTVIFDNLIVATHIVGYDPSKILGVYVGVAPIEDFMYAVLAVILIPVLWNRLGHSHDA